MRQQNFNEFNKPRSLNFNGDRSLSYHPRDGYELLKYNRTDNSFKMHKYPPQKPIFSEQLSNSFDTSNVSNQNQISDDLDIPDTYNSDLQLSNSENQLINKSN
jgi:hypothetical protein